MDRRTGLLAGPSLMSLFCALFKRTHREVNISVYVNAACYISVGSVPLFIAVTAFVLMFLNTILDWRKLQKLSFIIYAV